MLRELSRSTLYSSSRPSSSRATRRSSFSTLITILLPVLRRDRPRIRFTCSIIVLQIFRSHRGGSGAELHGLIKLLAARVSPESAWERRGGERNIVSANKC